MEYDHDDPPPNDIDTWGWLNRLAEETLRWLRAFGLI